jgi:hypothetical protein
MKLKSTWFRVRRFVARVIHIGCETCNDGKVKMTWWMNVCPVCGRRFPSPNGVHFRVWHEYLPELNDIEWNQVKAELEQGIYNEQQD